MTTDPIADFKKECAERIASYPQNDDLVAAAQAFNVASNREKYSYNFSWMGRPIIQYPQDMIAMQELIWRIQPDLIIETGIAHGGSLIYYASLLELIGKGEVLGIDIDIRAHNRAEIENHPMFKRITMLEGSAVDETIVDNVRKLAAGKQTVMVCLDSNHTHEHVLRELELYSPFVTVGSYLVVFDTIVEDMPAKMYDRPWDKGNSPKTAVWEFLKQTSDFEVDQAIDHKLLISVAPEGVFETSEWITIMAAPLVSIVIPVYNQRLDFFQEALTSALQQTYANVEVVVSNNHSTNDVPAYVNTLQDVRLRVVKPDSFLPMVRHFQFAADQARGEWILYLCSDDFLYPDCVGTLMAHLATGPETTVAAYGEIESVEHQNLTDVKFYYNRRKTGLRTAAESTNELLKARPFIAWMPGGVIRRSAYEQVREILSGEFTYAFDLALLFKLHELGNVFYVDKPLGKFRFWTAKDGKVANDRFVEFIEDTGKLCALIEQSPKLMSYLVNGIADVQAWRQYQANRWLLGLLVGFIHGDVDAKKCKLGIQAVADYVSPQTSFSQLLSWAVTKPQSLVLRPSLKGMHRVYSYMQSKVKMPF